MLRRLRDLPTALLAAGVLTLDASLWATVLPFEFVAKKFNSGPHPSPALLVGILAVNGCFLAAMWLGGAMTVELMRRGVTFRRLFSAVRPALWPVRSAVPLRPAVPVRSARSAR
jgi:hypothetical protein